MFKNLIPKGSLSGTRTDIKGNKDNKRSLQRENESADTLVEYGYNVEQNPLTKTDDNIRKGKQPDYRVNGEIFDNYAPNNKADVEQIRNEISRKVKRGQTYRVVLNLEDVPIKDIETMFKIRKPVLNLQQLIMDKSLNYFKTDLKSIKHQFFLVTTFITNLKIASLAKRVEMSWH
jgi:filamentous hemagglutinin